MKRLSILLFAVLASCTPTPAEEPEQTVEVFEDIELTLRGRIPENDPAFRSVEVYADRLVFTYDSAPSTDLGTFETEGMTFTTVVAGAQGGGYLREVRSVREVSPNVFEATTGPAYLTDFILRGHFHVHHNPRPDSFVRGENVATAALENSVTLLPDIGTPCTATAGASNIDVDPSLDVDVDFDVDIDIDVDTSWWPPSIRGRLESADFVMNGSVELGVTVTAETNGSVGCEVDLIDLARERGIPVPKIEFNTTFAVGPVPVVLNHELGPTASASITGSVDTGTATATGSVVFSVSAGTRYRDGSWREVWDPRRSGSGSFTVGEPGDVTIEAELSAGVEYSVKLYGVLGPKIGLSGSLTGTFTGNRCEWTGEVEAGISVSGGGSIEVPVIDVTLIDFEVSQDLATATLWEDMGTWPWCRDGGEPDIDAGTNPGEDAPETDPCEAAGSDCASCNEVAGCGFCASTGACVNDSRMGECGSDWRDGPAECIDCSSHTDCGSCMLDGFCGWCASSNTCLTADVAGLPPSPPGCGDWHYTDIDFCGL